MAIEITVLRRGDETVFTNVAAEVFDKPIDPKLAADFLADPRHPAMALYSSVGGTEGVGGAGPSNPLVGYSFTLRNP